MTFDYHQQRTVRPKHNCVMDTDRPNRKLSADVELALLLVDVFGARIAADFLTKRGAGFALTCRVLAGSTRRRHDDELTALNLGDQLAAMRREDVEVHQAATGTALSFAAGSGSQCEPPPMRTPS